MDSRSPDPHVPLPRKKACRPCSQAKVRCDHKRPTCTRCQLRGHACSYAGSNQRAEPQRFLIEGQGANAGPLHGNADVSPLTSDDSVGLGYSFSPPATEESLAAGPTSWQDSRVSSQAGARPHTGSGLVCTIDASAIECRWLRAFIPDPDQQVKTISAGINSYIGRILKSYAGVVIHDSQPPPFVHQGQLLDAVLEPPLARCFALLHICEARGPVDSTNAMSISLIEAEMLAIFEHHPGYSPSMLLAAFQAYTLYIIALVFHLHRAKGPALRQAIINLQQLASATATHGTMSVAEQKYDRPAMADWLAVESKRRTLYTTYILDNYLCAQDGLPVFLGTELQGLPAAASGRMWRIETDEAWRKAYNAHLCNWEDGPLTIDELWPTPDGYSAEQIDERRRRVDRWLEGVDEFGTMLYALTACTHGG